MQTRRSHSEYALTCCELGQSFAQFNDVSDLELRTSKHAYSVLGHSLSLVGSHKEKPSQCGQGLRETQLNPKFWKQSVACILFEE